jgi:hypothetical protein
MATGPITTDCHHCGVRVCFEQKHAAIQSTYSDFIDMDEEHWAQFDQALYPSACPNCNKVSLVGTEYCAELHGLDDKEIVTYPRPIKKPDENLPKEIQRDLVEIYKCKSVHAFKAMAVMSRRFLENCCSKFGIKTGYLKRRLEELLTSKFPNETLLRNAKLVKSIGDEGAHAEGDVSWDEAEAAVMFCEELAHHLFITGERFRNIAEARIKRGKKVS